MPQFYEENFSPLIFESPEKKELLEIERICSACGEAVLSVSQDAIGLEHDISNREEYWIVLTGEEQPDFNLGMIIPSGDQTCDDENLQILIKTLQEYIHPSSVFIPCNSEILNIEMEKEGFKIVAQTPLMKFDSTKHIIFRENDYVSPYRIEPVVNLAQLNSAIEIQSAAFGFDKSTIQRTLGQKCLNNPNVKIFIAYDNENNPVGTSTIVESQGIATIWNVGTLPEQQKKGIGTEIMETTMRFYIDRGIDQFYLIATSEGEPLYKNVGFETIDEFNIWGLEKNAPDSTN